MISLAFEKLIILDKQLLNANKYLYLMYKLFIYNRYSFIYNN